MQNRQNSLTLARTFLIRHWFLTLTTTLGCHLESLRAGRICLFLDAVRIVEKGGLLKDKEKASLRDWFREYLEWLENSDQRLNEYVE